jgi:Kef-type K+ transport system membrane component KefB
MLVAKVLSEVLILLLFAAVAYLLTRHVIPPFLRLLSRLSVANEELFQLGAVAVCLTLALFSEMLGLSIEVGSHTRAMYPHARAMYPHARAMYSHARAMYSHQ